MHRPAVFLAVAFLTGCWLGLTGAVDTFASLIGAVVAVVLYSASKVPRKPVRVFISLLPLVTASLLLGAWRGGSVGSDPLAQKSAAQFQNIEYEGVVTSDPEWGPVVSGRRTRHFELSLSSGEVILVTLRGRGAGSVSYGDTVEVRGSSRGGRKGRRYFSGWLVALDEDSAAGGDPFAEKLYRMRHRAAYMLEHGLEEFPEQAAILKALVLGYRKGISKETRDLFIATGSLHVFAISGLHIGIACSFVVFLLRCLRLPPSRWFPFLAVLLVGYTVMTGSSSSAVRACTMALVFFGGAFLGRKADAVSALACSAMLLCIVNPLYLYDPGFVLSFVVVGGICVLGGALAERLAVIAEPDPFLPRSEAQPSLLLRSFLGSATVSVSAWLVSAPLMLFFFGRLAPVGIVSNLAIVPIAFVTVLSGFCSLLFGNISLLLSDLFNHASLGLIFALEGVIRIFAKAPPGAISGVEFGLAGVVVWYTLLGLLTAILRGFFDPRQELPKEA